MSDLRILANHALVGIQSSSLTDRERELLRLLSPCGVIFFRKNLDNSGENWLSRFQDLVSEIIDLCENPDLLLSVDHEGGLVHRFYPPVTRFPAAYYWREQTAAVANAMGAELRALGLNLSFAPVLDCWSEPENTVIAKRAFSTVPEECASYAITFAEALEARGVLACGKHFPGHGATLIDSHHALPYLDSSVEELQGRELIPFKRYIERGFPLMMISHVVYNAIDPEQPATLSSAVIEQMLRQEFGFSGCVITDDLQMRALQSYTREEIATKALRAGADILLEGNPASEPALETTLTMLSGVARAIDRGELALSHLETSRQRIDTLRSYARTLRQQSGIPPEMPEVWSTHGELAEQLHQRTEQNSG